MEKKGKRWDLRLNKPEWAALHTTDHSLVCQNVGSLLCFSHLRQHFFSTGAVTQPAWVVWKNAMLRWEQRQISSAYPRVLAWYRWCGGGDWAPALGTRTSPELGPRAGWRRFHSDAASLRSQPTGRRKKKGLEKKGLFRMEQVLVWAAAFGQTEKSEHKTGTILAG